MRFASIIVPILLPVLFWAAYHYYKDRHQPEPIQNLILCFMLGLAASSLAKTEFQAVQMMPAVLLPQLLLAGLFIPRSQMPRVLEVISDFLPLSYATDAIHELQVSTTAASVWGEVGVLLAFIVGALALATLTLRRRTG